MLKYCKDCFYHAEKPSANMESVFSHWCHHPDNADIVSGEPLPEDCHTMRNPSGRCGRDPAKLFKLKIGAMP